LKGYNIALDVLGKSVDSFGFSKLLEDKNEVNFFIGGTFGFENEFLSLCENRTKREVSKSIMINDKLGWNLKDNIFSNPEYFKNFHSARCVKMLENMKKEYIK
jgi:hypothetical protein